MRKKTVPTKRRWWAMRDKRRRYAVVGAICGIALLALAALAGPYSASLSSRKLRSLTFSAPPPPPLPSPGNPSKEYIYAGGRLVATEEPNPPNPLVPPTNLVADTFSSARIDLSWTAAPNAHHYQVERASNLGGNFTVLNSNVTTTTFTDNSVTSVNAYIYRVLSADSVGNLSGPGSIDVATAITFTDDPLVAQSTLIMAQHVYELRQAVNAMRAAANLGAATWTDGSLSNVTIQAVHLEELRTKLDQALNALSLPVNPYTDASLSGVLVQKVHVDELRQRVQ